MKIDLDKKDCAAILDGLMKVQDDIVTKPSRRYQSFVGGLKGDGSDDEYIYINMTAANNAVDKVMHCLQRIQVKERENGK